MDARISSLVQKIRTLEEELEVELALANAGLHLRLEDGRIKFEQAVRERHERMRKSLSSYVFGARPLIVLTAPVIYSLIVPFVLLDVLMSLYQTVCFPVYGIPKVRRRDYFIFDRRYLSYLNVLEKLNCAYCSYANGLVAYVREIGSLTERYWCPIKHARKAVAAHPRYSEFVDFADAEGYRKEMDAQREQIRKAHE